MTQPEARHDMNSDDFRQYGKQLIDWIADYLDQPERYPVLSRVKPGEVKGQLPAQPPDIAGIVRRHPAGFRRSNHARHHALE